MDISTHTLTWSVTRENFSQFFHMLHFNSHAHVERDAESCNVATNEEDFNSHAHVERDE